MAFAAARFLDPHTLGVGGRRVRVSRVVICTGADAATPPIAGLRDGPFLTYETVFQLDRLPAHLLVLGAGPIGVELGQAFRRLGAQVTVVEQLDRLLSVVADPEVGEVLDRRLREEGLAIHLEAPAERIERAGTRVGAIVRGERVEGDTLLVATGRRPAVDDLGLEQAGVQHDGSGVKVDPGLRTSQRHIYAAGDATGSFQFTHYAAWQGFVAARNALFPGAGRGRLPSVPWAVFTDPEVAQVGLTEEEARGRGRKIEVHRWPLQCVDRAQTTGATEGLIKLVTERDGRLLGAALAGAAASELANELSLAIQQRLRVGDLSKTIHVYPTYGTGIQQLAAEASLAHSIKGWRGRLVRLLRRRRHPGPDGR